MGRVQGGKNLCGAIRGLSETKTVLFAPASKQKRELQAERSGLPVLGGSGFFFAFHGLSVLKR